MGGPTLQDVFRARAAVAPYVRRTPLAASRPLSRETGGEVRLKLENTQPTGAFKVRGAANRLQALSPEERERGVVTVSTGNHGRAVAHVAAEMGVRAVVCVSELVPANKVGAIEELGAELHVAGQGQDEAMTYALDLADRQGLTLVPPFDDPHVIAGQGTIGLEVLEDMPELDTVVVPLSGGGLLAGIALAVKAASPAIRTVGVSAERSAVMHASLTAGHPVEVPERESLADSLGGGIGTANRHTFAMIRDLVDEHVVLGEDAIARGMAFAFERHQLVLEGAGAVGIAALLGGHITDGAGRIAVVASGGNPDPDRFLDVIQRRR